MAEKLVVNWELDTLTERWYRLSRKILKKSVLTSVLEALSLKQEPRD